MIEIKLEHLGVAEGLAQDMFVSVRIGETQKLSRVSVPRRLRFPKSAVGDRKYAKLEVFRRVGGCNFGLDPEMEAEQEVNVPVSASQEPMRFKVDLSADTNDTVVARKPAPPEDPGSPPSKSSQKIQACKEYLAKHNIEVRLSEAVQAVLREKPEDPGAFVAHRLLSHAGVVTRKPKTLDAPPAKSDLAAPRTGGEAPKTQPIVPFKPYYRSSFAPSLPAAALQGLHAKFPLVARLSSETASKEEPASSRTAGTRTGTALVVPQQKTAGQRTPPSLLPFKPYYAAHVAAGAPASRALASLYAAFPPVQGGRAAGAAAPPPEAGRPARAAQVATTKAGPSPQPAAVVPPVGPGAGVLPFRSYYSTHVELGPQHPMWSSIYNKFPTAKPR